MCQVCRPFSELTAEEVSGQVEALSVTFVGLPMVVGAPLVMGAEYWREVARHQLECGVRACADIPAIKTYRVATSMDTQEVAGRWVYDTEHQDVETPQERIRRMAREQQEAYEAEVARRRAE